MSAPSLADQAARSGNYPSRQFSKREQQLLESVKTYVDTEIAGVGGGDAAGTIVACGTRNYDGSGSGESFAVPGALTTDLVFMNIHTFGGGTASVKSAQIDVADQLTYVLNGVDDSVILSWMVLRPAEE
jgi:hypothetical protein